MKSPGTPPGFLVYRALEHSSNGPDPQGIARAVHDDGASEELFRRRLRL